MVDDRSQRVAQVSAAGGVIRTCCSGAQGRRRPVGRHATANFAAIASTPAEVPEVYAIEAGGIRRLPARTIDWTAGVLVRHDGALHRPEQDGTEVHGLIVKPASYVAGRKYPTLLRIHGGPNGAGRACVQLRARAVRGQRYVVVAVNYRGSNGRGSAYQKAIFADWGNREVSTCWERWITS